MNLQITVLRADGGWSVFQDDAPIDQTVSKTQAVETAQLLTFAAKATGFRADLLVQDEDGRLSSWDADEALARVRRGARLGPALV